jgi:hypothetical protein
MDAHKRVAIWMKGAPLAGVQVVPALAVASGQAAGSPGGQYPRPAGTANSRCAAGYWLVCRSTRLASPCRSGCSSAGGGIATTGQTA